MNIQQLEYIVAVDDYRHFQKAAESCFITPATLSIMIKKLEEELQVVLFDRSKHPIVPTEIGQMVVRQGREILFSIRQMKENVKHAGEDISGEFRLGIIPTLAPYLLHLFLPELLKAHPGLVLQIKELPTDQLIDQLKKDQLDAGILALPEGILELKPTFLFNEKLWVFISEEDERLQHKYILPSDIDINRLWLLEEEHCLRSQIMNLCSLKKQSSDSQPLKFDAGSIETLLQIVEMRRGITIIPELSTQNFSAERKQQIRFFQNPEPVREISLVMYRPALKASIAKAVVEVIKKTVAPYLSPVDAPARVNFKL